MTEINKYKYGVFNTNEKIMSSWNAVDYFINNQIIYKGKLGGMITLTPLYSPKKIMIKYVLYALFDLYVANKKRVGIKTIINHIMNNEKRYNTLILNKANKLIEVSETNKFKRTNMMINAGRELKEYISKNKLSNHKYFMSGKKLRCDNVYGALQLLMGTFVYTNFSYKNKLYEFSNKKPSNTYYCLNTDGIKLMNKVLDENYLL